MLKKFKEIFNTQQFQPTFLGIFINPFYFLRKGLLREIKKNKEFIKGTVLDFGCGSKPYKNLFKYEKYIGLDIEKSGHDHKNEKIDVFYDGKTIPFKDEYFDSIFSSEVLEHVENLDEILKELFRVLKKDSYMLVTIPFVWDEHEIPFDYTRFTSYGIINLFKKNNFQIVSISKSTNDIETIFQMINSYIYQFIFPGNKYCKFILTILFISPFNILGIIFSKIFPKKQNFYNNNIVLVKKN